MIRFAWGTPFLVSSLLFLTTSNIMSAESDPTKETKQTPSQTQPVNTAPTVTPSVQPNVTAAIVAEGRYIYRQRDVDALVQIASRHTKLRFTKVEEDILRQAIIAMLISREPLQDAITHLPPGFSGTNRDLFILDVLDYEGEPSKATIPPAANAAPNATQNTSPSPSPEARSSLLIRLPSLQLSRTLPELGKRHLSMTIALSFSNRELAEKLQDRAPVIQDAILSYVQGLPPALFAEPNQLVLKDGITAAIVAKVPEFPTDAVLIPEIDTAEPTTEAKSSDKKTAP
jgi:hypothetical protein